MFGLKIDHLRQFLFQRTYSILALALDNHSFFFVVDTDVNLYLLY
jgi:hypothetical protein